jgi:hypothetical protein
MAFPDNINKNVDFTAGDTTYLAISPVWDASYGFVTPTEISIAQDGRIFIADSAGNAIVVLSQGGDIVTGFDSLKNLTSEEDSLIYPIDVDVDKKMNVFFIDGSNRVYRWNQLWDHIGIQSVASTGTFINSTTGDSFQAVSGSDDWFDVINDEEWEPYEFTWTTSQNVKDSLTSPHIFYDGSNLTHSYKDTYYASEKSIFTGLSATDDESNFIYVLDGFHQRMIRIDYEKTHFIKLLTGDSVWVHRGVFGHTAISSGSGAGTIDDPTGIDVDSDGNIYFAQHGESFPVHKIRPVSANAWMIYPSVFQPGSNDIMDLWDTTLIVNASSVDTFLTRFNKPYDVAVDQNQFVYVANTGSKELQVYNSSGMFFLKAGVESMIIDTSYWVVSGNDSSLVDTFYVKESHEDLINPKAITVDNRGMIYVCDPAQGSIFRYQLSNQLDEDLEPID